MPNKRSPTEQALLNQIRHFLQLIGCVVFRLNSGAIPVTKGDKRYHIRLTPAGTPDLIALKDGNTTFIEVKRPGKLPTPRQREMIQLLEDKGFVVIVPHLLRTCNMRGYEKLMQHSVSM